MKEYIKNNKNSYDLLAEEYLKRLPHYKNTNVKISQEFINNINERFSGEKKVLDLGCGAGLNCRYFEDAGFKSFVVEISEKMIEVAKLNTKDTKFFLGDFLEYDFREMKFEGIFGQSFIHLFTYEDSVNVMKKIHRILVDKGIVFIGTTKHEDEEFRLLDKKDYKTSAKRFRRKFTEKSILELIKESGFRVFSKNYLDEPEKGKTWMFFLLEKSQAKP